MKSGTLLPPIFSTNLDQLMMLGIHLPLSTLVRSPTPCVTTSDTLYSRFRHCMCSYSASIILRPTSLCPQTSTAITAFFHAMLLFPEISQRVYEEIIFVTDGTRLPQISDRASLPFTEAVWKECVRWNTCAPLGLHHASSQDEVINGYTIKAGTIINTNIGFV